MKTKKLMVTGIIAGALFTVAAPTFADSLHGVKEVKSTSGESIADVISEEESRFMVDDMKVPSNTYIIDKKIADVTGDEVDDTIYLIGHKGNTADRYADKLNIVVRNGATNNREMTDLEKIGGYEGKLFIGDFSGDKVKDVMITAPTGGSGGIVQHIIVNFNVPEPIAIFDQQNNAGAQFTGKYVDGFKAELVNQNTGRSINIDLNTKKDMYVASQIYNKDGTLLKEVKPITYPLSLLEPIDMDGDGTYELKGIQSIKGAYGADTISHVNSLWKFEDNQWNVKQIEVSSFLQTLGETRLAPAKVVSAVQPSRPANEDDKSFEQYFNLIGMKKEKLADVLSEKPTPVDEGGLEFTKAGIRVWFGSDGNQLVQQVYIRRADIDYNGLKIGDKINAFKQVFGEVTNEDYGSAYANFDYKGKVLNINYDPKTEKTISAYIMEEWK